MVASGLPDKVKTDMKWLDPGYTRRQPFAYRYHREKYVERRKHQIIELCPWCGKRLVNWEGKDQWLDEPINNYHVKCWEIKEKIDAQLSR